jgi:L-fucose isomerase-like protein
MKRALEPDGEPDITRGTLEGRIKASDITLFRLQSAADTTLRAYIAEGETLDVNPNSFGGIGVMAVPEMARFYRHALIEKRFPHHAGVGFRHAGKTLWETLKLLGVRDIGYNRPSGDRYCTENPF